MHIHTLPGDANVRGAGAHGLRRVRVPSRCKQHWVVVASAALLGCSEATDKANVSGGAGGGETEDAGVTDAGVAGGPFACPDTDPMSSALAPDGAGPALIVEELRGSGAPVRDGTGITGIDGTVVLQQSVLGGDGPVTTPAELVSAGGKLCLSGNTVIVPLMSFEDYWGAAFMLYFLTESAAPVSDAGVTDAGVEAGGFVSSPWDPALGDVTGFSFVIEANDAELWCGGLPPRLRLQTSPVTSEATPVLYCQDFANLISGQRVTVRFSEVRQECWDPGGRAIFADPLPAGQRKELYGLSWLIPADQVASYSFDFCISDIRPIIEP